MTHQEKFLHLIKEYLSADIDALIFALSFSTYCHAIDDIVDGDKTDAEFIIKTFEFAACIYSSPFYQRNIWLLYPLVKATSNAYADSVNMERSNQQWRRNSADVLRQYGNEVLTACVEVVKGQDARREFSLKMREIAYEAHHNLIGEPV